MESTPGQDGQTVRKVAPAPVTSTQADALAVDLLQRAATAPAPQLRALGTEIMALPADIVITRQLHMALERGARDPAVMERLKTLPGLAVAEALRVFPGPMAADPFTLEGAGQCLEAVAPLCRVLMALGPAACALAVARAERSPRPHTRAIGVRLAHRTGGAVMAVALLNRLLDPEPAVAAMAGHALTLWTNHSDHAPHARTAATLLAGALMRPDATARDAALRAALHFRHPTLIPPLIALMTETVEGRVRRAHMVLRQLTHASLPCNVFAWNQWWNAHEAEHPVEWLLAAMDVGDLAVRQAAHQELLLLTGPLAAYQPDEPRAVRQDRVAQWRQRWTPAVRAV